MLHTDDTEYFERIRRLAFSAARAHGLALAVCEPKRRPNGAYGLCYVRERRIAVLVREKRYADEGGAWFTRRFDHATVLDTVAHELAHLTYANHSAQHKALTAAILRTIEALDVDTLTAA
jgi:hypothetical protein